MSLFDFQPYLADSHVSLRPLRADDWAPLYAIASDPAIWAVHPARHRWQEPSFRAFFNAGLESEAALVIEAAATGAIIGSSRYGLERAGESEVEIGWTFLAREYWGGGTNAAVKRMMIGHALASFDRAIFLIGEDNVRSRRALEKIGGMLIDREMMAVVDGQPIRHVIYAIDRAGFAEGPLAGPPA